MYVCIHIYVIYICIPNTLMKKEATNLKEEKRDIREGLKGRKGKKKRKWGLGSI